MTQKKCVAATDQGTTSTRFTIFDKVTHVVGFAQKEHRQIYPQPGWVEHDPLEIWNNTQEVIKNGLDRSGISGIEISAVGITNQRETTVVWNNYTGEPYYDAIVWQDVRTYDICRDLSKDGGQNRFQSKVGLPLATHFSGPKLKWLLDHVSGVQRSVVTQSSEIWIRGRCGGSRADRGAEFTSQT
jgi:glycerol kinase